MKKILVFDLDGTLVDSLADIHYALNGALGDYDLPAHSMDSVKSMIGHGLPELIHKALPKSTSANAPELHDKVLTRMRELYGANAFTRTIPYPGISELVTELKASGATLAVLTNKAETIAKRIVEHFFPGVFVFVQGEVSGLPRKPDPEALYALLKKVAAIALFEKNDIASLCAITTLIGDSEADIETALAAGVRAIGVSWGFRSQAELRGAGASEVYSTAAGLRQALRV